MDDFEKFLQDQLEIERQEKEKKRQQKKLEKEGQISDENKKKHKKHKKEKSEKKDKKHKKHKKRDRSDEESSSDEVASEVQQPQLVWVEKSNPESNTAQTEILNPQPITSSTPSIAANTEPTPTRESWMLAPPRKKQKTETEEPKEENPPNSDEHVVGWHPRELNKHWNTADEGAKRKSFTNW